MEEIKREYFKLADIAAIHGVKSEAARHLCKKHGIVFKGGFARIKEEDIHRVVKAIDLQKQYKQKMQEKKIAYKDLMDYAKTTRKKYLDKRQAVQDLDQEILMIQRQKA